MSLPLIKKLNNEEPLPIGVVHRKSLSPQVINKIENAELHSQLNTRIKSDVDGWSQPDEGAADEGTTPLSIQRNEKT